MEGTRVLAGRRPFMPRKPAAAHLTARTPRYTEAIQASRPPLSSAPGTAAIGFSTPEIPHIPTRRSVIPRQRASGTPSRATTRDPPAPPVSLRNIPRAQCPTSGIAIERIRATRLHGPAAVSTRKETERPRGMPHGVDSRRDSSRGVIARRRSRGPQSDATIRPPLSGTPTPELQLPEGCNALRAPAAFRSRDQF